MGYSASSLTIDSFRLHPGRVLAGKYVVIGLLGSGWEGEVYLLRERATGVERAGKFFFPHRNKQGKVARVYAQRLHRLRKCPIVVQYHTHETMRFRGHSITFLVSEFVEGEQLSKFLGRQQNGRLTAFEGLHLLHSLAVGVEAIHNLREYHGDLHSDNIIVRRHGISFDLKLVDVFNWDGAKSDNIAGDVCDLIRIFYDSLGGQKTYARQPAEVKAICCGLKRGLILKKYRTAGQLRQYLETMEWSQKSASRRKARSR
jgi:serine/threonine protein kinase